jgi:hypothetical protein
MGTPKHVMNMHICCVEQPSSGHLGYARIHISSALIQFSLSCFP